MHYKNGRAAKNGDKVLFIPSYGSPLVGILYDAQPGNNDCNGRLAVMLGSDPMPDLKDCIHIDDVKAITIPDSTVKVVTDQVPSDTAASQEAAVTVTDQVPTTPA